MTHSTMQLLVSVRNAIEAQVAVQAGVDIIDVKEPNAGPLGFAGTQTVLQVQHAVAGRVPVSAALGECLEWMRAAPANLHDLATTIQGLEFVKLGLAVMQLPVSSDDTPCSWVDDWQMVRNQLLPSSDNQRIAGSERQNVPQWVAVAYADHERAAAPCAAEVLEAAIQTGCSTLLIDTFCKDGSGTLNWLTQAELQQLRIRTHRHKLRFALAGQLTAAHLTVVQAIQPDVFAVRGAVCEGQDRTATVSAEMIRRLKALL